MAYVRERRVYRLLFEGDLAGLEVSAKSAGMGDYLEIADLSTVSFPLSAADIGKVKALLRAFALVLVSWNLEEPEGVPVPTTLDGLLSQDPELVQRIILAWMEAVAGVSVPLSDVSSELEASLPMEALAPAG